MATGTGPIQKTGFAHWCNALRPIILDNACILNLIAAASTELADAYSPDTVIAYSPGKEVHDPWAFYLHAALLCQAFAHCGKFSTASSHRSLGRVSVPVWLIILSDQLLIIALVSYCLTNKLIRRKSLLGRIPPFAPQPTGYYLLVVVTSCCSPPKGSCTVQDSSLINSRINGPMGLSK
ncbi:hypothetical protein ACS0TY_035218 [Phlomoides rotata]